MEFAHFKTAMQFRRWPRAHLPNRLALYRKLAARALAELARRDYDHKFSTTQVNLPQELQDELQTWVDSNVPTDDLHPTEKQEPPFHVTVKYGLHAKSPAAVEAILEGWGPVELTLGSIDMFTTNEDYDVLIVRAQSDDLVNMNHAISDALPHTDTQASYSPHVTLAYLKKGAGDEWVGDDSFTGKSATIDVVQFGSSDDDIGKTDILLERNGQEIFTCDFCDESHIHISGQCEHYAFCPTGEGGGIDPTCSPKTGKGGETPQEHPRYKKPSNRLVRAAVKDARGVTEIDNWRIVAIPTDRLHFREGRKLPGSQLLSAIEKRPSNIKPIVVRQSANGRWTIIEGHRRASGHMSADHKSIWVVEINYEHFQTPRIADAEKQFTCAHCGLHRYHLPGQHDQCSHSPTGECESVESGKESTSITQTKDRVFAGDPVRVKRAIGKQGTGRIGEALAVRLTGAKHMNGKWNNFPIDLVRGDTVYEVKAGLVSNRRDAQKWSLTFGEPGKKEKQWLANASAASKARWYDKKGDMILVRKQKVMAELEKKIGRKIKAKTMTFIVNPDKKTADVFEFDGFHPVIRWKSEQAAAGYKRTVKYG